MLGAIIGDLAGSIYEYDQFYAVKPIKIKKIIEDNAFFSDDTILTIAVADAILSGANYGDKLREYALKYNDKTPKDRVYFETMFSPNFAKWAKDSQSHGKSIGNGAMMRVSPVGYLYNSEEDVVKNARLVTIPSHNTTEAIDCAKTIALIIFYARHGMTKDEIVKKLDLKITKPIIDKFNYTCKDTIGLCLYSWYYADSFEDSIRLAISFGGDTDTNACIVGSMAEAMYGIDDKLIQVAISKLPKEFVEILRKSYKRMCKDIL